MANGLERLRDARGHGSYIDGHLDSPQSGTIIGWRRSRIGTDRPAARITIAHLPRKAQRTGPAGEVQGANAADIVQVLSTGHVRSLSTVHADDAQSALSRLASCATQAEGALPWDIARPCVVNGIALVFHT